MGDYDQAGFDERPGAVPGDSRHRVVDIVRARLLPFALAKLRYQERFGLRLDDGERIPGQNGRQRPADGPEAALTIGSLVDREDEWFGIRLDHTDLAAAGGQGRQGLLERKSPLLKSSQSCATRMQVYA